MAEPLPENTDKKREESKSAFNQTKKTPNHKHLKELRNQNIIKPLSTATLDVKQVPTLQQTPYNRGNDNTHTRNL